MQVRRRRLAASAAAAALAATAALAPVTSGASAPRIRSVHMSVKKFAVGDWNTPLTTAGAVPRGTQLRITLNRAATIVVVVKRLAHGRVVGGQCVAATHKNRHAKRCQHKVEKMRLTRNGHAGKNPIHFSGRSDGIVLNPGPFVFVVHAELNGLRSESRTLHFRVLRG